MLIKHHTGVAMKNLPWYLFFLLPLIYLSSCRTMVNNPDDVLAILNTWYEPIYEDTSHSDLLQNSYGEYVCLYLSDDRTAYMFSETYGYEGPYDWCLDDNHVVLIDDYQIYIDRLSKEQYYITIENGLTSVSGTFIPCYSVDLYEQPVLVSSIKELMC
jgi:hypothetical protein